MQNQQKRKGGKKPIAVQTQVQTQTQTKVAISWNVRLERIHARRLRHVLRENSGEARRYAEKYGLADELNKLMGQGWYRRLIQARQDRKYRSRRVRRREVAVAQTTASDEELAGVYKAKATDIAENDEFKSLREASMEVLAAAEQVEAVKPPPVCKKTKGTKRTIARP